MTEVAGQASHERCGAKGRAGKPCALPAGWGTPTPGVGSCRIHGGNMPNHRVHAQRVMAERACDRLGLLVATTPAQALRDELHRARGAVAWAEGRIAELQYDELFWGQTSRLVRTNPGYGAQRDTPQMEITHAARLNPVVALWQDERKRLAMVAVEMARLRIDEQVAQVNEKLAAQLSAVLEGVLDDLHLSAEQRARVGEIVPRRIRHLEAVRDA